MATDPVNLSLKFINQTRTHHYYLTLFWLIFNRFGSKQTLDTISISSAQSYMRKLYESMEKLIKIKLSVFKIAF